MRGKRFIHTFRLWMISSSKKRADYARKYGIYNAIGENVSIMDRKVPLYANLIRFHNNIRVASNVSFITHDITHNMLNCAGGTKYQEVVGCIEVMDNVFIGSNMTILNNVRIGPNAIIAAGSVVNKDVPPNSIAAGVPARVIGSFDEYVEKRKKQYYPQEIAPNKQEVCVELAEFLWKEFDSAHEQ